MIIIKHKNIFFALTGLIMLLSLASFIFFGLKLGTDFTGGTLAQVTYANGRPSPEALQASLEAAGISGYSLREANTNDYILRAGNLTPAERSALPNTLSLNGKNPVSIDQLTEVGPTIGTELRNKALVRSINTSLTVLVTLLILFAIGPASTTDFALTLLVGIVAGTYSSIFLPTPLLLLVEQRRRHKRK